MLPVDLEATLRQLAPKVLGFCVLETGDAGMAEEISQDALTALVQRWRRYGPPDAPAGFVFAIARRRCARAMVRRRLWCPLEEVLLRRDGRQSPEERTLALDRRARMTRALQRLRRPDRQVLLMVTVGNLGMEDTARALGISLSAAKMRAMRARARLREVLDLQEGNGNEQQ